MTSALRAYIGAIIAGGAFVLAVQAPREYDNPALVLTLLAAMGLVSLFKLRIPLGRGESTMSMAYVIDFLVLVTMGADVAMVIAAAGVLVQCLARVRRRQSWYRTAFSVAAVALAVQTAGWTWSALGGTTADPGLLTTVIPLMVASVFYFAVNVGLVGGAIALSTGVARPHHFGFIRTAPAYLVAGASVAAIQLLLTGQVYLALPAIAVPMVACHLAYATWFRRVTERPNPTPVFV